MFSLFRGAYGELTRKEEHFALVLGLDGAGKTTYIEQVRALFDKHHRRRNLARIPSTVGLNHVKLSLRDCVLNFWDLGGQRELRSLWDTYLAECQALVFVVDSTDATRLGEVFTALESILAIDRICRLPLMILFNKCDLNGSEEEERPAGSRTAPSVSPQGTTNSGTNPNDTATPLSPTQSNGRGGWSSFELDNNEVPDATGDWDLASSTSTCGGDSGQNGLSPDLNNSGSRGPSSGASSSCNTGAADHPNSLMDRFRRQYFNNHISTVHQGDVAIFSISALQNINVKRSACWLINAMATAAAVAAACPQPPRKHS